MKSVYIALGVFAVIIAISVSGYCLATGFAQTMLDDLKEKVDTNEYIEKVAREKLGLVKENEIIFIDVASK